VTNAAQFGISETLLSSIRPRTLRSPNRAPYRLIDDLRPIAEQMGGPFLIFTKEDVFLIQGLSATSLNVPLKPIVAIRRPLHPGRWVDSLMSCDRHCFFSQIPELGVFIVGSPAGRVGVFSLYYTRDENTGEPRYGFELEYLLPFRSGNETEIAGGPNERLLGVAVAPLQGKMMMMMMTTSTCIVGLTGIQACLTLQKISKYRIKKGSLSLADGAY